MFYSKPQLNVLGTPIMVIHGQPELLPCLKPGFFYQDAPPYEFFNLSLTIGAYDADE